VVSAVILPIGRRVTVEVPASSANLGPGFDVLALALDLWLRVTVETTRHGHDSLEVVGEGEGRLTFDGDNRVVAGLMYGHLELGGANTPRPGFRISMHNEIPLGRGLGSSAAASVAGLLALEALAQRPIARLPYLAALTEGHPDNAAAALYGGFVLVADERVTRFDPPADLHPVVFIPMRQLSTAEMRKVVASRVRRETAVVTAGHVGQIVAAFATGDLSLLSAMNDERLHEPARSRVFPELAGLKLAAIEAGALGAALSGAGSSVIAMCDSDSAAERVCEALRDEARRSDLAGEARQVRPASRGASVVKGHRVDRSLDGRLSDPTAHPREALAELRARFHHAGTID
jgi:homoserine kinase